MNIGTHAAAFAKEDMSESEESAPPAQDTLHTTGIPIAANATQDTTLWESR